MQLLLQAILPSITWHRNRIQGIKAKDGNTNHGENSRFDLDLNAQSELSRRSEQPEKRGKCERFSRAVDYFLFTKIVVAIHGWWF